MGRYPGELKELSGLCSLWVAPGPGVAWATELLYLQAKRQWTQATYSILFYSIPLRPVLTILVIYVGWRLNYERSQKVSGPALPPLRESLNTLVPLDHLVLRTGSFHWQFQIKLKFSNWKCVKVIRKNKVKFRSSFNREFLNYRKSSDYHDVLSIQVSLGLMPCRLLLLEEDKNKAQVRFFS